ncbi:hypothetical protein I5677_12295 [Mobilitalea sibirica]|uniref:SpoVT-AbrB domain-containing protein n=1 Tax=Mobilitalea sibirica TaxID=1462919 RepID=A0A8J7HE69_9FIRM|nr:AbrB/MazE/SpoVT family DNA-binding domain-containing protein [Mobilitalea sibirica]MBH1941674.1 hypothetical protein [Mobilitalea sibirica]
MAKGIIRKIDELGRITIPIEYRRSTGIEVLEPLDLYFEGNVIHLKKGKGRKLDELGRYTIPSEIREKFGYQERQPLEIYCEGDEICIRKEGCEWCSSTDDLIKIGEHLLCKKCAYAVVDAVMEE